MRKASGQLSLLARLLAGILLPVAALVSCNTVSPYAQALEASDTAYDLALLASAKSIGELLHIDESGSTPRLRSEVAYSALEAFEADNRSRIFYKVIGFDGEVVSGFADLPAPRGDASERNVYAALVRFYDDAYDDTPVRMAVLLQPVAGVQARGMATIQVAASAVFIPIFLLLSAGIMWVTVSLLGEEAKYKLLLAVATYAAVSRMPASPYGLMRSLRPVGMSRTPLR